MKTLSSYLVNNEKKCQMGNVLLSTLFDKCGTTDNFTGRGEQILEFLTYEVWNSKCVENHKYTGWVVDVRSLMGWEREVKLYVPNWVFKAKVKDHSHANNLFRKYVKFA